MLLIEPGTSETLTVPTELNWPDRLNRAVWSSSQVMLVAFTGESELMSEPERIRSVACTVASLTGCEKSTTIELGAGET